MAVIYYLINDLIDKRKVFPNRLFTKDSTIISEHFHHAVNDIENERGRDVVLGGCNEEYAELFSLEKVNTLYCLLSSSDTLRYLQMMEGDLLARI